MERVGAGGKADQLNSLPDRHADYFEEDLARYRALGADDTLRARSVSAKDKRVELSIVPEDKQ